MLSGDICCSASVPMTTNEHPAYERLAATMRDSILAGDLAEGARLPSEAMLATQFTVSRSTVREALRVLEQTGFLQRTSPRILVVRSHSEEPAFRAMSHALRRRTVTFSALYESLLLLEPALARMAAERREQRDLEALSEILDAQRAHARDFAAWCRLDEEFHLAIAEASSNAPLVLARATFGQLLVPTVAQFVDNEAATRAAIEFHDRLYTEIRNGDGEMAAVIARRHVEDFHTAWVRSGLDYHRDISRLIDAATGQHLGVKRADNPR
jgi:GntR family transcriptional repressor for pyruvate dehydrogenase complex